MNSLDPKTLAFILVATLVPPFVVSWAAVYLVRRWAPALGLMDRPGERKVHEVVTPLGGGLGIWAGVIVTFGLMTLAVEIAPQISFISDRLPEAFHAHRDGMHSKIDSLWVLLGAGTVLVIIGLIDDRVGLDWKVRLGLQFGVAAICVAWQGWRITAFINIPLLTAAISVVWIVALINAFNMLDNMDGLSGGVATIAAAVLAAVLLLPTEPDSSAPQIFVGGFLLVFVGAIGGFLMHNLPPAKIFMGDGGSYFVGFCIAIATLLATFTGYHSETPHAILAPLFVMAVPFYDMLSVIIIRLKEGRSPFHADKSHLSHRLVDLGLSKWQAVLTIYLLTATCGLGALLLHRVDWLGAVLITMLIGCVLALIAILETTARRRIRS